ncbi:MAG: hypothetical protein HGA49_09510 [Eubacteriaceae bacterium]|nr:hypothetical protein [Eubacteriaceae bacterium]
MDSIRIAELIGSVTMEEIFGYNNLSDLDWVWINRDIFRDIIMAADKKDELEEAEMDEFLRLISDEDFIELVESELTLKGFIKLQSKRYKQLESEFREFPIETWIFVNRRYLSKLLIKYNEEHYWILQAMSLDLNKYHEEGMKYIYTEYFENNSRILEEIAVTGTYQEEMLKWKLDLTKNVLECSYKGNKISQWSGEEARYKFNESIKQDRG